MGIESKDKKQKLEEGPDADAEAPSTGSKQGKTKSTAPADAPVVTGKRQRKSVEFFKPEAPVHREKKAEKQEVRTLDVCRDWLQW